MRQFKPWASPQGKGINESMNEMITDLCSLEERTGEEVFWDVFVCFENEEGLAGFPDLHTEWNRFPIDEYVDLGLKLLTTYIMQRLSQAESR